MGKFDSGTTRFIGKGVKTVVKLIPNNFSFIKDFEYDFSLFAYKRILNKKYQFRYCFFFQRNIW